jgi:acylphosphatase
VRRTYRIEGEVQGVGYRFFVVRVARRLGLGGWVRNLPDGSVEALAEGDESRLAQFEVELRRGPSMAHVTGVHRSDVAEGPEGLSSFEIR